MPPVMRQLFEPAVSWELSVRQDEFPPKVEQDSTFQECTLPVNGPQVGEQRTLGEQIRPGGCHLRGKESTLASFFADHMEPLWGSATERRSWWRVSMPSPMVAARAMSAIAALAIAVDRPSSTQITS